MALIISPAISLFVAPSIPSSPGDEFTSNNKGPFAERIISTPATYKSIALAALIAIRFSSLVTFMMDAVPPKWMLALNSPGIASR